jgi:hypothetical protein
VEEAALAVDGGDAAAAAARAEAVEAELGAEEREAALAGRLEPVRHHVHLILLLLLLLLGRPLRPRP